MPDTLNAALAMYRVNRVVSRVALPTQGLIYRYKTAVLRRLCLEASCMRWAIEEVRHPCWHTEAHRTGLLAVCPRCDNTGIFRVEYQVRFHFILDGRNIWFHQPIDQVNWFDKLIDRHIELEGPNGDQAFIRDKGFFVKDMETLRAYSRLTASICDQYREQDMDRLSLPNWYGWKEKKG